MVLDLGPLLFVASEGRIAPWLNVILAMLNWFKVLSFIDGTWVLFVLFGVFECPLLAIALRDVLKGPAILDDDIWSIIQGQLRLDLDFFMELVKARRFPHGEANVSPLYQLHFRIINYAWRGILALKLWDTLREVGQFHFPLNTVVGRVPLVRNYLLPIGRVWQVVLPRGRYIKVGTKCMLNVP